MGIQILILEHEFSVDVKTLYEQFFDLRKYGKHHPVMTEVKVVLDKSPEYIEYEVDEVVPIIGPIKMYPNYKAKVYEIEKNKTLQYTSQVKKNITLKIDITFSENNGKTKVTETISVTANKLAAIVFLGIIKKTHLKLFSNLNASLQQL